MGRAQAIKARLIAQRLGTCWRQVLGWKAALLLEGYRIGAAKAPPFGLFICTTADEWRQYAGVTRRTIRAHAAGDRALERSMRPVVYEANGQGLLCELEPARNE